MILLPRKVDLWEKVVHQKLINLEEPVSYVNAKDIKKITGEEPRLMASMDQQEDLPSIFSASGVFILPVSRSRYAIVKGQGYHRIEQIDSPPVEHVATLPLPVSQMGVGTTTETQYLDYAYNTGLFERFLEINKLWLGPRGKMTTPAFEFRVGTSPLIKVEGAQIEIDGSYLGDGNIVPVEAKVKIPQTFAIKQLYYPYRTLRIRYSKDHVRSLFFAFDDQEGTYNLWEYEFTEETNLESIMLIRQTRFRIRVQPLAPENFIKAEPDLTPLIPQADDFQKVLEFPIKVSQGKTNSKAIAEAFRFTSRQSSYYRQATEMLGLVMMKNNQYGLTNDGRKFVQLSTPERNRMACELLFRHPIMHEVLERLISHPSKSISRSEVIDIIRQRSKLGGTTLPRRTQTIFKWFEWIQRTLGIVVVRKNEIGLAGMQ